MKPNPDILVQHLEDIALAELYAERDEPTPVADGTQDYSCTEPGCPNYAFRGNYCTQHGAA